MPGIMGVISDRSEEWCEEKVNRMIDAMRYEKFYRFGHWSEPAGHAYVGWTGHSGSYVDLMPIANDEQQVFFFLAGELFPNKDAFAKGTNIPRTVDHQDIARILNHYERSGEDFVEALNGWFSGLVIDRKRCQVLLFNDRYGMSRLFLHQSKEGMFFSSEAKALLAVLPECREFDLKGLTEYVTCGCTISDRSLYKNIKIMPGASLYRWMRGRLIQKKRYYERSRWESQSPLEAEEFLALFNQTFTHAARQQVSRSLPAAVSLTGGLDSRMLLKALDPPPFTLPCYSFGSMFRDTFDVKVARRVASAARQSHQVITLGADFLSDLFSYLEKAVYISDGYLGLSGGAELYANRHARNIALHRLTGNWGGEFLRGTRAFRFTSPKPRIFDPAIYHYLEQVRTEFSQLDELHDLSFSAFVQAPHQGFGRLAIERSQIVPSTPFFDNAVLKLLYRKPEAMTGLFLSHWFIGCLGNSLLRIPTDRGHLGDGGRFPKAARRTVREATFKGEYFIGYGAPDWLVRRELSFLSACVEPMLLGRHKFYHFRQWLRECWAGEQRDYIFNLFQSVNGVFAGREAINQILESHFGQRKNLMREVDLVLTLALIEKRLFSNSVRFN